MINKFLGIGNLTKAVEVRFTDKGLAIANFTIAIAREKKEDGTHDTDFVSCVAYGKQAETMSKYLDKGSQVGVEGRIRVDSYENKEGKKVYTTYIAVERVTFINTKKKEESKETQTETIQKAMSNDPYEEMGKKIEIENVELPF